MDKKNLTCYILWLHILQKTISHFLAVQELLLLQKKIISEKKPTLTQTYETKRKSWHDVQNKQTNKQTHTHFHVNQWFENDGLLNELRGFKDSIRILNSCHKDLWQE